MADFNKIGQALGGLFSGVTEEIEGDFIKTYFGWIEPWILKRMADENLNLIELYPDELRQKLYDNSKVALSYLDSMTADQMIQSVEKYLPEHAEILRQNKNWFDGQLKDLRQALRVKRKPLL